MELHQHNGKWGYVTAAREPGDIWVNGDYKVKRLEVNQAQESLGIQIRPNSKMIDEVKYLRAKAVEWGDAMQTKRVRREEAWYCFQATIMKTIEYPLVSTTISKSQIQYIISPILNLKQALNEVGKNTCPTNWCMEHSTREDSTYATRGKHKQSNNACPYWDTATGTTHPGICTMRTWSLYKHMWVLRWIFGNCHSNSTAGT